MICSFFISTTALYAQNTTGNFETPVKFKKSENQVEIEQELKRLKKQGNVVELLPENSEFSPIVVDLRENNFSIEGLAVGVIRNGEWL